jgi:predicted dehydrogenase
MNRRDFLMGSAAAAAVRHSVFASPNDTVRVAVVGMRGRGWEHVKGYYNLPNVEVAALCDVDENLLSARFADIDKMGKKRPARFVDFRKLLEDKSIDAVSIATPDHHHTLQTIWACQAGKDVYVEKPCSHNMFEARQIMAAAAKYNRVVQHGTQGRTGSAREAVQSIRDGLIGDVYMARALCYKFRNTIGRAKPEAVPAGVHYDLWLGPAPPHQFTKNRFHYNWHWFWDYGEGEIGNEGIHQLDAARWALGVGYPTKASMVGGHFMFDDDQETPNTLTATYEFGDGGKKKILVFEARHGITNHEAGIGGEAANPDLTGGDILLPVTVGCIVYGSKGYLTLGGEGYRYQLYHTFLGRQQEPGPSANFEGDHFANFIDTVRSRKHEELNAPIHEGAISTTLVHLANISYRLGRTVRFDAGSYSCPGDREANEMFSRQYSAGFVVPERV